MTLIHLHIGGSGYGRAKGLTAYLLGFGIYVQKTKGWSVVLVCEWIGRPATYLRVLG